MTRGGVSDSIADPSSAGETATALARSSFPLPRAWAVPAQACYHWALGRRPDGHPGLSDLGL